MAAVQTIVICTPGTAGVQGPCPSGQIQAVTQGYIAMESPDQPFDPVIAGQFFGFAVATTIILYLLAFSAGLIIRMVRHA